MDKKIIGLLIVIMMAVVAVSGCIGNETNDTKNKDDKNELNETDKAKALEDFKKMDKNNNGKIDVDELPEDIAEEYSENIATFFTSVYQSYLNE